MEIVPEEALWFQDSANKNRNAKIPVKTEATEAQR
jgi:hypothetical protein